MTNTLHTELGIVWAAIKDGSWAPMLSTVVTAVVGFGWLDGTQASQINIIIATVATVVNGVIALVHLAKGMKVVRAARAVTQ